MPNLVANLCHSSLTRRLILLFIYPTKTNKHQPTMRIYMYKWIYEINKITRIWLIAAFCWYFHHTPGCTLARFTADFSLWENLTDSNPYLHLPPLKGLSSSNFFFSLIDHFFFQSHILDLRYKSILFISITLYNSCCLAVLPVVFFKRLILFILTREQWSPFYSLKNKASKILN